MSFLDQGKPAIEVTDLVIEYPPNTPTEPTKRAVAGVSFAVETGSILALLGPNGAGKTSTIETLSGHRQPTAGSVRVLGLNPRTEMKALAPHLGVMLQQNGVYLTMTPLKVLRLFASYYGDQAHRAEDVLGQVGLTDVASTPWRRLSGGEQQRLSLGMALVGKPKLMFLDEPTAGMDVAARQTLWKVIRDVKEQGSTVLLTTHYLEEAERLADRVIIVDHGHVVADDTPEGLRTAGTTDIRFTAVAGLDVAALGVALQASVIEVVPGEYLCEVAPTPVNVAALTTWLAERNVSLGDLRAGRQRLEDVFLQLTASEASSAAQAATGTGSRRKRSRA